VSAEPSATRESLRIEGVSKRFGEFLAVNGVSLSVRQGEIFALLGSSGCGKTTLLRMLAGFETPTGRILIDGEDMAGIPPYERPVNMMFQSYALFPHLSVERNVAFGLEQEKLPRPQIARRVADMLAIVKMTAFAARKPQQLSGGQRQRVALARALVKRPKLLLLDEPLGALDRKLREHTQFELLNIQQELGVTFVVVTHDQEEAMTLATRIGVMDRGEIVQIGTPREVYESPASKFVADFVGTVNLFAGEVVEHSAATARIRSDELGIHIRVDRGSALAPGSRVWAAIRPEKIEITRLRDGGSSVAGNAPGNAPDNAVDGVVREIAYLGGVSTYLVEIAQGRSVRVTRANSVRGAADQLARDAVVRLSWHASSPVVLAR
jgi:putrescine transport system ATP-binding protein